MIQPMRETRLRLLTLTGIFAALICLFTAYICHIPVGPNGGYLHFGDTFIYVAASLLPQPYALLAGAIGGGLADLLTAPMWHRQRSSSKCSLPCPLRQRPQRFFAAATRLPLFFPGSFPP